MSKKQISLFWLVGLFFVTTFSIHAQSKSIKFVDYAGLWKGDKSADNPFEITVTVTDLANSRASIILSNQKELFRKSFTSKDTLNVQLDDHLFFEGIVDVNNAQIDGFIKLGLNFYPVQLHKNGNRHQGTLNLSANHYLHSESLYLEIRKIEEPNQIFPAYPLLGTYWVDDLKLDENKISFVDYKTGLLFKGELQKSQIALSVYLASTALHKIYYKKVDKKEKVTSEDVVDGMAYSENKLLLPKLANDIDENILKGVESVIVAQNGKIRYENYFRGTNAATTNDLRSAGKSIGSAMIGIAIDDGIIANTKESVYDHLPKSYQYTKDEAKAKITIEHLLTMRSGIGVYEDDYQETEDWLKTVLEPKLKYEAGTRTNYMSADPFLLSVNLSERLSYPLEFYMHQKLFGPLGIDNYILNTDDQGNPYFAGGLCMTPRDMLKFGQLYLNKGMWKGKRILTEKWITDSFKKHTKLENTSKKNAYGYFWWHETYTVNNKTLSSIEARGNGGQYISILPELDAVIVVTTENYNKRGAGPQTQKIISDYILAKLLKE